MRGQYPAPLSSSLQCNVASTHIQNYGDNKIKFKEKSKQRRELRFYSQYQNILMEIDQICRLYHILEVKVLLGPTISLAYESYALIFEHENDSTKCVACGKEKKSNERNLIRGLISYWSEVRCSLFFMKLIKARSYSRMVLNKSLFRRHLNQLLFSHLW